MKLPHSLRLAALAALVLTEVQPLSAQGQKDVPPPSAAAPIPFSELGAKATADYKGDAIGITATAEGATLRTGFQKLAGTVTREGLRLESTDAAGGSLQLKASAVGRVLQASQPAQATPESVPPQAKVLQAFQPARTTPENASSPAGLPMQSGDARAGWLRSPEGKARNTLLPAHGIVTSTAQLVTFTRPGLTEEYSVSVDGVRQDFIVSAAPAGPGQLSVELTLSGATAEAAPAAPAPAPTP